MCYSHEEKHFLECKTLPASPPTRLSDENLRWGRGWALSDDVVAGHGDLVVPELLQLYTNTQISSSLCTVTDAALVHVLTCQLKLCHRGTADRLEVAFS